MRVAGTILSLSLLVSAAPAFAQGGSYYDRNNWYNRQSMAQDGQGYISPEQQHLQSPPTYPGDWQQQSYGQQNYGGQNYGGQSYGRQPPSPYWQTQPGSMQQGMQSGYPSSQLGSQLGSQSGPFQTGQTGQRPSAPVSSATQGQIRSSLEASGFKNVTVLPQSYLIRATAPDGSQVVMQVSSDGVYGVVVNSTDQASSSGTGGAPAPAAPAAAPGTPAPAPAVQAEPGAQAEPGHKQRHRERQHRRSQRHWRHQQRHRKCRHRRHKRHWGHKQRHQQSQHRRQRRNRQHRDWGQQQHRRGEQHRHRRHQRQEQRQGADDNPLRAGCFRLAQARHREIAESDGLRLSGFPGWPDNWHRHGAGHAPFGAIALSAISTNWRATPGTLV